MPDGVIQWFDPATGEARLLHGGRRYACRADDIDPACRSAGAHVHFDIDRHAGTAVAVVPRTRRRTGRRSRRPGSAGGPFSVAARSGGIASAADSEVRRVVRPTPIHLARWWAAAMAEGSLDEAAELYAPTASLDVDGSFLTGERHIRAALEAQPLFGSGREADHIRGDGDDVVASWSVDGGGIIASRFQIRHGEIVSQSIDHRGSVAAGAAEETGAGEFPVQVVTRGPVTLGAESTAVDKVLHVSGHVDRPVLFARINLTQLRDPAATRPAIAEATLDVDGEIIRGRAAADRMMDAIDRLEARLANRLRHHAEHRDTISPVGLPAEPHEWRHGNAPTEPSPFYPRPKEEREVVSHQSWAGEEVTVDEAVLDLELLDQDFHLFRELLTGQDSVVARDGTGSYTLRQAHPDGEAVEHATADVSLQPRRAPVLKLGAAIDLLDLDGEPWVFFVNALTERGNVVYRRLDGHYGLVTPE